jgi:hydroxyacyl-ACP dehydratase HTD2-like protein with hotdog domain
MAATRASIQIHPLRVRNILTSGKERKPNLTDCVFLGRMWAGGRLKWHTNNGLKIGQRVTEHTKLFKADAKRNKLGQEMIVAGAEKQYETEDGIVLTDQRYIMPFPMMFQLLMHALAMTGNGSSAQN